MEEKFSALEALGVFRGLLPTKQWNALTSTDFTKQYTTNNQSKPVVFNTKSSDGTEQPVKAISLTINQNVSKRNDPTPSKVEIKKEAATVDQYIPLKPYWEVEMTNSETDIPKTKIVMNANCDRIIFDNKEKTKDACRKKEIDSEMKIIDNKKNSLDGTCEDIESSENKEVSHGIVKKNIPSAVQEWVDHLPLKDSFSSKEDATSGEPREENPLSSEDNPSVRAQLSREASLQSNSSLDSILDSRRPDPVEIFLNLGFGGLPGLDTENCRIPKRFLVPSKCKGGDWNEFLKRELIQAQNFECSSLGFRGLSGPSYRRPSAIVANIMEKLREHAAPPTHNRSRFSTVAKMVLNERSVLNKLTPEFQSVLSPDSRKFLQNQGKKSPEVPRRRIIFGQKSFAFAHDGEFVEVESSNVEEKTTKDSPSALNLNDGDEPSTFSSPEVLLKLRRSSLQKQKKVDEDADVDDVFFVVGKEEHSTEPSYNTSNNDCSKKADKIPRRFLSSSNLKALEENLSEAMRLEVEKEILNLSQKIKSISNQDLPCVLQQVKELRSKIENSGKEPAEV